jgi:hypothetical protein
MFSGSLALPKNYSSLLIIWLPFLLIWIWAVRYNPLTHIPAYGDALEVVWGANWYADKIRHPQNPLFFANVFYPSGWPTALQANTPIFLLLMGLTSFILPEAAVYNLFLFLSFLVAYAGMLKLARLYVEKPWIALLAALLYTFWGTRWVRLGGQVNLLWLSALLPWLCWVLLSDFNRRRKVLMAALIWTLCIIATLYGVWLGAVIVGVYVLNEPREERLLQVMWIAILTLIFSLPTLLSFGQARQITGSPFYLLEHISGWGASINSLPIPAVRHPWLQTLIQKIYPGPFDESDVANLGFVAVIVALVSLAFVRVKDSRQRFAVLIFIIGMVLALGPFLRWNGQLIKVPFLAPVNRFLWQIGSLLKPEIFYGSMPSDLELAIPLPAWLLYAAVPYFEGSRIAARFAFVGGIGLLLLVAQILGNIKKSWLLALLVILLLFERFPWPVQQGVPMPMATHPAFEWLALQTGGADKALLDLIPAGDRLTLAISAETLFATDLHNKPIASGASSMWPESAWFLIYWLQWQKRPLHHPDLPAILDDYGINWVLVHMKEDQAGQFVTDPNFANLQMVACFDPADGPSAWPYPICVLEVQQTG